MSENPSAASDVKLYQSRRAPGMPVASAVPLGAQIDGPRSGGGDHGMAAQQSNGGGGGVGEGMGEEEEEHEAAAMEAEGMDGELEAAGQLADTHVLMVPQPGSNQLTLSFQGEVYVFDSVSPEKVQAVLLLLGGRELSGGLASLSSSSHQYNRRSNFPQRVASLMRFREKRKERNFDKKIRYNVRKEVALRMQRNKGQFTSSKSKAEDATSGVTSWDATQRWGADDRPQAAAACHHCGISSQSTPMMRRGPDGPRTLCNACGLMWANKGTLRDLSKNPPPLLQNPLPEMKEGNGVTETAGEQQPHAVTANGHDSTS